MLTHGIKNAIKAYGQIPISVRMQNMKRFQGLLASIGLALLASCGNVQPIPEVETGTFEIDEQKPALKVILYGTFTTTPDEPAVRGVIDKAEAQGLIKQRVVLGMGIEGGVYDCLEIPDSQNRALLIQNLRAVRTSLSESRYSLQSLDACPLS